MKPWMRRAALMLSWGLLAGCAASPVEHFHTLRPLPTPVSVQQTAYRLSTEISTVSVAVGVPPSADRPQWLVRTGPTQVQILEQQRWIQPLSHDMAEAVALHLSQTHGIIASAETTAPSLPFKTKPSVSVQLTVVQFETLLAPAPGIHDEMKWVTQCKAGGQDTANGRREGVLTVSHPISSLEPLTVKGNMTATFDHLATAHANALAEVSRAIATAVSELGSSCSQH